MWKLLLSGACIIRSSPEHICCLLEAAPGGRDPPKPADKAQSRSHAIQESRIQPRREAQDHTESTMTVESAGTPGPEQ